jgi:putative PIN family toxin of toxin-antitoxin system
LIDGRLTLLVSNEILLQYEEVVTNELGIRHWRALSAFIDTMAQFHGNVERVTPRFRFTVLANDPDDNKFCDCAIAGAADFVVTYDEHFDPLASS